jgi:hypothetical protein
MERGKLIKMNLIGFEDAKFKKPTGQVYTVLVNPETYTFNHEVLLNKEQASGNNATPGIFHLLQPQRMEFEFLFDGTGALVSQNIPNPLNVANQQPVNVQIDLFKRTVLEINGETHQAPYVRLEWGTLYFEARVEKLQLIYKLFKPDGTPLRVVAKTTFVEVIDPEKLEALVKKNSPDLTHIRTIRAGDTLPLLCQDIYKDPTLYREVARVNKLVNFRNLTIGQKIFFPPVQKN